MRKIWLYAIIGFLLVATAALATLVVIGFLSDDVEEYVEPSTTASTTTEVTDDFDSDFLFGAASASYQIEGAWNEDGRSPTIWDTLVHNTPDLIANRDNGDVAADSYRYFAEDVKAIKETGFNFYRFSISWARILPDGAMTNQAGVDCYNKLIDELIANDIEPVVTMYHWDLPQYIQDLGGWTNEIVIDYFDHYSDVLYEKFGDRVKKWMTFNEPYVFCHNGYGVGSEAPLIQSPGDGEYLCSRHVLLAHAKAYHNYKNNYATVQRGEVGICINSDFFYPTEAAHAGLATNAVQFSLGWFANPIYSSTGNYPQIMIDNIQRNSDNEGRPWSRLPAFTSEEIESIKGSSDFFGLNYYSSRKVEPKTTYPTEYGWEADAGIDRSVDPAWPKGKSSWLYVVPEGLHDLLMWIKNQYNNPRVWIMENGYSDDGQIQDNDRISYIKEHLKSVKNAINDGCDVKAYTVWSIIDNFEWLAGYAEKFGVYHVNFTSPTKERTAKDSSRYLREVISTRKIEI